MTTDSDLLARLNRAAGGDAASWHTLVSEHSARLRRMVALRLDHRLQGRIDPSDVLQEVYLEAAGQMKDYLQNPALPFFLWLRLLVSSRLNRLHRYHLGTQCRAATREVSLFMAPVVTASSFVLADQLLDHGLEPAEEVAREEMREQLRQALDELDPMDREALVLRHFEQLTSYESAQVLGINEKTASKRYLRALRRLKNIILQYSKASSGD